MSSQLASVVDALPPRSSFKLIASEQFVHKERPAQRIKGLLPKEGLVLIYGFYGTGKSFFALDLVMSISAGYDWQGLSTQPGRVVYVVAEGVSDFKDRYAAYLTDRDLEREDIQIFFVDEPPNLLKGDGEELIRSIKAGGGADVVVFDTLSQCMPGGDENSSATMTQVVSFANQLVREFGALVIYVTHSGKDLTRGVRGHTALPAAADVIINTSKSGDLFIADLEKRKDGLSGSKYYFSLKGVELGLDEDGDLIKAAVAAYETPHPRKLGRSLGKWQRLVIDYFSDCDEVSELELIEAIKKDLGPTEGHDRRNEQIRRAIAALVEQGLVTSENGRVRVP